MNISLKNIYISTGHNFKGRHGLGALDYPIEEVAAVECVAGRGLIGDRFFDYEPDFRGQITFFDQAVYQRVMTEIVKGEVSPTVFRRNVMVQGVDLNSLIGERFRVGGLEFTGSCECTPCYWMDQSCAPGTFEFLKGQGGLRARIVKGGELKLGDYALEQLGPVAGGMESSP